MTVPAADRSRPLRVIGYVRVSTEEQAAGGLSLDAQRAKLRAYAELHELELVAIEEDAGASAKTLTRPGLRRALDAIEDLDEADGLLIAKLDRLSRSVADWNRLVEGYFGPPHHVPLFSVQDSIDTRTAAGRLVLNVLMTVAQWEREVIVERTREALDVKRARGERIGGVPYGYRLAGDGRTLVPEPVEQVGRDRLFELREFGLSYRAIARTLNAEGHRPKHGGRWGHQAVAQILKGKDTIRPCEPHA